MSDTITRQCDDCGKDYDFLPDASDSKLCEECREEQHQQYPLGDGVTEPYEIEEEK